MRAVSAFAIILAVAPTLGATPAAVASKQTELKSWATWLESVEAQIDIIHEAQIADSEWCPANTNDVDYPYRCVAETFVAVSVCAAGSGPTGCLCTAPLPSGFKCSTDSGHGVSGTYDEDDVTGPAPDCTQLDTDFAASTDAATVIDQLLNGALATSAYKQMGASSAFFALAVITGQDVVFRFPHNMRCGLVLGPIVGPGASFVGYDAATNAGVSSSTPTSTADVRIYNPTVLAGAATSHFTHGKAMVVGGNNAGSLSVGEFVTKAELSGLTNSGTVSANGVSDLFIADTINSGAVTVTGCTAKLVGITNEQGATVTVSGSGSLELYETSNELGATVTFADGTVTMDTVSNAGAIVMTNGSVTATAITNTGSVAINAGTIDLTFTTNTGTITVAEGVTGMRPRLVTYD